ncbi:ATP-grasp domain-containing protein [Actinokineospora fastidiosa]|uniref:ATP-grasp domain-containing protein n=1 Tax=Actinokineospora fastidiosa TaxID=1816 RepID=A0A918LHV1_9PSEU|nr:hypothetical protein [Actinokineospora fastidiosa]GGS53107.1 hypothetical protein GCM10010171_55490 [Actinokineospora fastidiosa]
MILTITIRDDLHTIAVQHAARSRGITDFHIVECDHLSGRASVTWRSHGTPSAIVRTADGVSLPLDEVSVLWWRRVRADQRASVHAADDHQRALVNNDCRGALAGALAAGFHGRWVSAPEATDRAADKLYQLTVAARAGFRVPQTLVSQSRDEVVAFVREVGRVIVKPVVGASGPLVFTQHIDDPAAIPDASFGVCPAIYQEYIPGTRHIRLNCFGERMHAALIETGDLDWRPNLNVPISRWPVPDDIADLVLRVLRHLGLRMGVIDLKLTPQGEAVWLEVNPQGQFLFLEPLIGEPLTQHFLDFLITEHTAA